MPQPKSTGGRSSGGSSNKRTATSSRAKRPARSSSSGGSSSARSKSSTRSTKSAPKSTARARSGARSKTSARPKASTRSAGVDDSLGATLTAIRDRLLSGVVLTGERLQETVDDSVRRGRLTRSDAEDLVSGLIAGGRKQTEDLLNDIESLLDRSRSELTTASKRVRTQARRATGPSGDRVLREVDRARRAVGIGPAFPVLGYDDLAAAQITPRLEDLNSAQLRKVRDYERRHGNRKSVLDAIERKLK